METELIKLFTLTLIVSGAFMILFSYFRTSIFISIISKSLNNKLWAIVRSLMIIFFFGYLLSTFILVNKVIGPFEFVTALVFFMGAFFVQLIIVITTKNVSQIDKSRLAIKKNYEALQKVNQELDTFVYRTAHDLRAPVSTILGLIQIINLSNDKNEKEACSEMLHQQTIKLDQLISNITNYAYNAHTRNKPSKVNLHLLFEEIITELKALNTANQHKYLIDIQSNVIINIDKIRLRMILSNLITNSIQYFDQNNSEPRIEIQSYRMNGHLKVIIKDNGIGIPQELQKKVFDMFYRAHEKSQGSGLGLFLVKEMVTKMGGRIKLDSKVGRGSKFMLSLPVN